MTNTIRRILAALSGPSTEAREMAYLNEARDLVDLEYRQRQVDRGMFRSDPSQTAWTVPR